MEPPGQLRRIIEERGHVPHDATWRAMSGGRSNHVWRVGEDLVCKLYRKGRNPLFGNTAEAEILCLQQVWQTGLAPKPFAIEKTDFGSVVIYEHAHGPHWHGDTARVAVALRRVHRLTPPHGLQRSDGGALSIVESAQVILARVAAPKLADLRPEVKEVRPSGAVLLHGDIVPSNIIETAKGICFIDWQSPSVGDAILDIACFLSPAMQITHGLAPLTSDQISAFWAAYDDPAALVRYTKLAPLLHWRMACYCAWRVASGDAAYVAGQRAEIAALAAAASA